MSEIVPADQIEAVVGVSRHPRRHYARAISDEQLVYILHSALCKATTLDLRECPFSMALDNGIEADDWIESLDQPVRVTINRDARLIPVRPGMRFAP
jgi:hypothetical protein